MLGGGCTPADIIALTMEATCAAGGTLEGEAPWAGGGGTLALR